MPTPPEPTPLIHCLKVKIVVSGERGVCLPAAWVEAANYPAEGGLEAFYDLMQSAPDDSFMTSDASCSISFASIVAIRRPKGSEEEFAVRVEVSPPGAPRRHYPRLRVRVGPRGEIVEVANVPWTENGIAHFGHVIGKHRNCDFVTADSDFLPVKGIRSEDLRMPGAEPVPKVKRLCPEDILRPEDLPE